MLYGVRNWCPDRMPKFNEALQNACYKHEEQDCIMHKLHDVGIL
jgi:transposase-like protein